MNPAAIQVTPLLDPSTSVAGKQGALTPAESYSLSRPLLVLGPNKRETAPSFVFPI
jgi:hypothetical protein